nr:RNA polymerase sigma factor [Polyangiaceae bacterium]
VFAYLSRLLGRGPLVEDLAQETFLRAFRAIEGFDPQGAARPSTWLLTIATRLVFDDRKRRRLPTAPLEDAEGQPDHLDPERQAERARLGRAIEDAARELSEDQRAAFLLMEFHGFSVAEAAATLKIPENTVKQRVFRAREKLRSRLAGLWNGGSP